MASMLVSTQSRALVSKRKTYEQFDGSELCRLLIFAYLAPKVQRLQFPVHSANAPDITLVC